MTPAASNSPTNSSPNYGVAAGRGKWRGKAPPARRVEECGCESPRRRVGTQTLVTQRLYFRPMKLLAVLALALTAAASLPTARAQNAGSPTVYNIEIIVFRNQSGAGGPEDWNTRAVARGPD